MKKTLFTTMLAGAMLLGGCATYEVRFADESTDFLKPFPATIFDAGTVAFMSDEWGFCGFLLALPYVVDLPFSLVSDTVCLPYDLATMK